MEYLRLYKLQPPLTSIIYDLFWELGTVQSSGDTKERHTQNLTQSQLTSKHTAFVPEWLQTGNSSAYKALFEHIMSLQFVQKMAVVFPAWNETPPAWVSAAKQCCQQGLTSTPTSTSFPWPTISTAQSSTSSESLGKGKTKFFHHLSSLQQHKGEGRITCVLSIQQRARLQFGLNFHKVPPVCSNMSWSLLTIKTPTLHSRYCNRNWLHCYLAAAQAGGKSSCSKKAKGVTTTHTHKPSHSSRMLGTLQGLQRPHNPPGSPV